jgi:hypothetical protein
MIGLKVGMSWEDKEDSHFPSLDSCRADDMNLQAMRPNVMVEWLTLLLHIQEVLDSNLGPETSCSCLVFSQSLHVNVRIMP